jgi:hypothetical protein
MGYPYVEAQALPLHSRIEARDAVGAVEVFAVDGHAPDGLRTGGRSYFFDEGRCVRFVAEVELDERGRRVGYMQQGPKRWIRRTNEIEDVVYGLRADSFAGYLRRCFDEANRIRSQKRRPGAPRRQGRFVVPTPSTSFNTGPLQSTPLHLVLESAHHVRATA